MAIVALVVLTAAFVAGVSAARRFVPTLAHTREGQIVFWVVAILLGAAAGLVADALWEGFRALATDEVSGGDSLASFEEQVVTSTVRNVLTEGSLPLGLAAIIYLLGPETDDASRG